MGTFSISILRKDWVFWLKCFAKMLRIEDLKFVWLLLHCTNSCWLSFGLTNPWGFWSRWAFSIVSFIRKVFRKKPAVGTYTGMWSMKRMCRWILWKASWASVTKKPMGIWCKPVRRMGRGGLSDRPRGTGGSCSFDGIPADRRTKWTQGAGWTPPLVTNSIPFCWLFTIEEKCKKFGVFSMFASFALVGVLGPHMTVSL